ncbi:MAG: VOC family protein [Deltaproteobacteria bacterium]|nr:VOC family protein [Deltaproteobacteria bacterium]
MVKGIYHINVNVTNFERSLAFYQLLEFKIVRDLGEVGSKYLERGLRIAHPVGRAALLQVGDDRRSTRLDLLEWKSPKTEGRASPDLTRAGMARIALVTEGLRALCEKVKAANIPGVEFFSEPQVIPNGAGGSDSFVCFTDPDGTVIELIEFGGV